MRTGIAATAAPSWSGPPSPTGFVVEELGELPPGRALDLGSGEGRDAVWLAERGWQVTAVDFSPVAPDKARRLAQARGVTVDFVLTDLCGYRPEPGVYHLVLVAYLHLPPLSSSPSWTGSPSIAPNESADRSTPHPTRV